MRTQCITISEIKIANCVWFFLNFLIFRAKQQGDYLNKIVIVNENSESESYFLINCVCVCANTTVVQID